jgi:hypothetical protein
MIPEFASAQLAPPSVERNTPPHVPAKRVGMPAAPSAEFTASALTAGWVKPVFAAVQLFPSSMDRKTPPQYVPT